ncbi:mobilome CxxCx(11)CxxC protein [Providencia manganoxydans]
MNDTKTKKERLIAQISTSRMHAEGTADFLKEIAGNLEGKIKMNQFLTFLFPVTVGLYAAIDKTSQYFDILTYVSGFLSTIVGIMTLWIVTGKKNNDLGKLQESYAFNTLLKDTYLNLQERLQEQDNSYDDVYHIYTILKAKDDFNAKEDEKLLKDKSARTKIMFNFLKKHNKPCISCNTVPKKFHKSKGCNVCGNVKK